MASWIRCWVISSLTLSASAAWAATFTPLGPGTSSPTVSAAGSTVVGLIEGTSGLPSRAFIWDPSRGLRELGDRPDDVLPTGVSRDGSIVVGYRSTRSGSGSEPFVWDAVHDYRILELPAGSVDGAANAISADGSVIVGNDGRFPPSQALLWNGIPGVDPLGDLPGSAFSSMALDVSADGSVVVGFGTSDQQELPFYEASQAFIWDALNGMRGLGGLPGQPPISIADAISGDGSTVVGTAQVGSQVFGAASNEAFIWDAEHGMRTLGRPPLSNSSRALDVSHDGSTVVGMSLSSFGRSDAFIWDEANGLRSVDAYLRTLGIVLTGWRLERASGISEDGMTIVGTGINPNGQQEAWIAVIPEPSTTVMLGMGLASLTNSGRRGRHDRPWGSERDRPAPTR